MLQLMMTSMMVLALPAPTTPSPGLHYYYPVPPATVKSHTVDVCVYGGTPGGMSAAVQAARMGKTVVLAVPRRHVGGMTSGGLTATDLPSERNIGGIAREAFHKIGKLKGYKPSEAEAAFLSLLAAAKAPVLFEHRLQSVEKTGNRITAVTFENGARVTAKMFVDATYEGDLFAKAAVSFHVGREANSQYGETINGIEHHDKHQFMVPIDPYKTPGDPKSGLLFGITTAAPGKNGDADHSVQAYNFRMWMSNAEDRVPFPKPTGYDRDRYALLLRYIKAVPAEKFTFSNPYGPFQMHAGDCNNDGGFSTDYIGANYGWPEGDYATRERIYQDHVNYQQGLVWFTAHDSEVPELIRAKVAKWGLARSEFPETGHWPHELYVREARRMVSEYVMTESDCRSKRKADDSVGLAAYNMDSHNARRIIVNGHVRNEGDVQIGCPRPYPISYRSIVPKEAECANLLVPVCLSATHIAYGSIRMEPVFMVLGQSAGSAACMAIDAGTSVQKLEYAKLRERLLTDNQVIEWVATTPAAKKK